MGWITRELSGVLFSFLLSAGSVMARAEPRECLGVNASKRLYFYKREMGGNPKRVRRVSRSVHLVIILLAAARLAVLVQQRRRLALLLDAL